MSGADALALLEGGRPAEAAAAFRDAALRDPASFEAWAGLGEALATQGDHAAAIAAMRKALALAPGEAWLRVNLARSLFALGHVSEAVRENEAAARATFGAVRATASSTVQPITFRSDTSSSPRGCSCTLTFTLADGLCAGAADPRATSRRSAGNWSRR